MRFFVNAAVTEFARTRDMPLTAGRHFTVVHLLYRMGFGIEDIDAYAVLVDKEFLHCIRSTPLLAFLSEKPHTHVVSVLRGRALHDRLVEIRHASAPYAMPPFPVTDTNADMIPYTVLACGLSPDASALALTPSCVCEGVPRGLCAAKSRGDG